MDAPAQTLEAPKPAQGRKRPRKLSRADEVDIVREVRERIEQAWEHERINIAEAITDQRYRANDQWPDAARRQREADGRPILTFNRLNTFVSQVVNPIKQADKSITAKPDDNTADPTIAKVVDGLLRKIQRQSNAHSIYGHTLECQAGCSIGWIRLKHDYCDDNSFEQEIYLDGIQNPIAVYWDPAARGTCWEDMMWACVTEMIPEATFKDKYPKAALASVDYPEGIAYISSAAQAGFAWRDERDIRVAEYYKRVPVTKKLGKLYNGKIVDLTDMPAGQRAGMMIAAERTVNTFRVEKYIVSGVEVLEGPADVPGCYVPLVPAKGGEIALDRGTYRYSVIRFARDAQTMYNLNRTAMAEWIGQSPKAPWLVTPKMIAQHRQMWDSQGQTNRNYLLYAPDKEAPGARPERSQPPEAPVALAQDAQFASEDMKYGTGIHDASLGAKSQEVSGVALRAKQMEGDVSNYHFSDNFQSTLTHIGTIILSWIPVIYDTPRTVLLVEEDGTEKPVQINTPVMDPQTGQTIIQNDLSNLRMQVQVDIGPSYSTRRIESAEQIGEFMKAIPPQQASLITDIYARNQDWEGHEEIADRLKATIPPQVIQATQKGPDGQPIPPPPQPPDPMMIKQLEKISAEIEQIRSQAAVNITKAMQTEADVNAQRAQILQALPGLMDPQEGMPPPSQNAMQPPPGPPPGPQ